MSERKCKIMDVNPEVATKWLEKNTHNRTLRQTVVEAYASAMRRGDWRLTSEPIAFSFPWTDAAQRKHPETLINGQHRLWAVILANTTAKFTVWWGCDPEEFHVVDQVTPRTQGDMLKTTRPDITSPGGMASAINAIKTVIMSSRSRTMTWETELMLKNFPRELDLLLESKKRLNRLAFREMQAALFCCLLIDEAKTGAMVERLATAVGFSERDPVRALHLYLHGQLEGMNRETPETRTYKILCGCMAQLDGRTIQKLQPSIDYLGEIRRRCRSRIEGVVKEIHGGSLPFKFYDPRGALRDPKDVTAGDVVVAA